MYTFSPDMLTKMCRGKKLNLLYYYRIVIVRSIPIFRIKFQLQLVNNHSNFYIKSNHRDLYTSIIIVPLTGVQHPIRLEGVVVTITASG